MTDSDEVVRRAVTAALHADRDLDAVDIEVAVDHGVVALRGEVGSAAERLAARSLALGVPGVVRLVDELQVAPLPGAWRLGDDEIAALVAERFAPHPELAHVVPTCSFHVVQLDGVVPAPEARRDAHHLARTTSGVHFVIDRIETAPTR